MIAETKITVILQLVFACMALVTGIQGEIPNKSSSNNLSATTSQRNITWDERYKAAVALLDRCPILKPNTVNALSEDEFLTLTRIVLGSVNLEALGLVNSPVNPVNVQSVDDAIEGLEALISITLPLHSASSTNTRSKPEASIISNPENLKVRYRRTVDHRRNKGTFLNATTNMIREVEPAVYTFILIRRNGEEDEQVVNCTKNCVVRF